MTSNPTPQAPASAQPLFAHLHVHTEYSLADGAIRIKKLLDRARTLGHKAIAITDHGVLFGAIDLYAAAKEFGVKPIIGCEIFHSGTPETHTAAKEQGLPMSPPDFGAFHLVLLAKNLSGYHQLVKIVSDGFVGHTNEDGMPIVPVDSLSRHAGDMIALSSCAKGELAWIVARLRALSGEGPLALDARSPVTAPLYRALCSHIQTVHSCVGVGNYYVELIDNNLAEQKRLLRDLVEVARHFHLPLVASADAHYLDEGYAETHTVLLAIKASKTMKDLTRRNQTARFHLLNNEEFLSVYQEWPEAIANTLKIADECNLKFEFGKYILPKFALPNGESEADALGRMAREMLEHRFVQLARAEGTTWDEDRKKIYRERLEYEIKTIIAMGFPGYFLIVQDFINWAKDHGIPVGPGRGSGVGSLVAYALRITDLDPIRFQLLFERFLNPERVSMPDFDVDFCQDRRGEVIRYVTSKYGQHNVAQITTFGKMLAKLAVRDVGRVLEMGYGRVDKIAKLIPAKMPDGKGGQIDTTIAWALESEPRLKEEKTKDSAISELLDTTARIQGLCRQTGTHAAGIVITDRPLTEYVPVYTTPEGDLVTQFEMKMAEKTGLVKFDFLGLKTLTVIERAVQLIRKHVDPEFDITTIPLDEPKVFEELSEAHTVGVFQMEGRGLREVLARLKPNRFEDIIAMVALYRPGPLGSGMVDSFIERKHGREPVSYALPQLEDILKETYGVILYQEQVMKVAQELANYSLGEADLLRRAMGKKKPEEMAAQKSRFLRGASDNKIDPKIAEETFDLMAKFAEYGFNKSHSAGYALVAYQTAYLKALYPAHFLAAAMTCDSGSLDKIVAYVQDCRRLNITVLPPDINHSDITFTTPDKRVIDFSLGSIKGVGVAALDPLVKERQARGPFASLEELARRVDLRLVGKKTLELLTSAGGMDSFGLAREEIVSRIPTLFLQSEDHFTAKASGLRLLFGEKPKSVSPASPKFSVTGTMPVATRVPPTFEDLMAEKKLLGTWISAHPLDSFREDLRCFGRIRLKDIPQWVDRENIPLVGLFTKIDTRVSKKSGALMTFVTLEDHDTTYEARYFPKGENLVPPPVDTMVVAFASVRKGFEEGTIRVGIQQLVPLETFRRARVSGLTINIDSPPGYGHGAMPPLERIKSLTESHTGNTATRIKLLYKEGEVVLATPDIRVDLCDKFLQSLRSLTPMVRGFDFHVG